ncbi:hypothetical protein BOTBODRAFT_36775 [Botryobasidium botryosum FD-172 SS1]|uniref:RING-type domain-containing protein n=1 Tax=Botryobasidium botryosum (strain FD-172 SS1) TaxID=930990 RepID=A0A067M2J8_BOTB1|nr:hypothetical protein BOTBODRAFT_36775 [Botryobasidium botryosum FD-172 SS1]
MAKHSRNNTASSVFTYAERRIHDYGTKKQRLGRESMRRFDACSLCLQRARDPVACQHGHLYCKECVYTDLLAQKKEIKRYQAKLDQMAKEEESEKQRAREAARARVLKDFETSQSALATRRDASMEVSSTNDVTRGVKRKFDFDQEKVDALALAAEDAALKQIEIEQAEARRAKLPDFWLPSLTPQAAPAPLKDIKLHTLCHASSPSHSMNLKSLIPVKFSRLPAPAAGSTASTPSSSSATPKDSSEDATCICPSCKKELSNSTIIFLIKPCSHVVCKTCNDSLIKPSKQCAVCDTVAKDDDVVEIKREGTGFSAGGRAESVKVGVAFQG